jgi:fatty-acyl-CoA synthase
VTSSSPNRPHHAHWPRRLPRELTVPETPLGFNLEVAAARWPRKAAMLFFGRALDYAALKAQAEAIAGWLHHAAGVRRGDRVALYLQNCPQYVAAFYGAMRADAVVVPVNPMNRAEELRHRIDDSQATVVVCSADLAGVVDAANRELAPEARLRQVVVVRYADAMPDGELDAAEAPPPAMLDWLRHDVPLPAADAGTGWTRWNDVLATGLRAPASAALPDDLALLPYTSGTTGRPRAACTRTAR